MKKKKKLPLTPLEALLAETKNELINKIIKDLELRAEEIAEAVELFYDCQKLRIMHVNKERTEPPSEMAEWIQHWIRLGEHVIASKLKQWVESENAPAEAHWAFAQVGIGPIIAAGLAAHIDPEKAKSISAVWKFAGFAPGFDRKQKGVKLPYNSRLKVLCFKIGESFVKVSGKEDAFYGQLYNSFKAEEIKRNEAGRYKEAAERELGTKSFKNDTATRTRLLQGKLSDGHLHSRAKRRTVKIFLSHYLVKGWEGRGLPVTDPYPIRILKHSGEIKPPAP